jgi:hypothetical protein
MPFEAFRVGKIKQGSETGRRVHHNPANRNIALPKRPFMKTFAAVILALLLPALFVHAEESFTANGSTVVYAKPDASKWNLVRNEIDPAANKYVLMFKHTPIKDAQGRDIEPAMAIVSEPVTDGSDVVAYSALKRTTTPFTVKKLLTPQDGSLTYKNGVGYEGEYTRGDVLHKVFIAHMRHKDAGIQMICDSTDGVYSHVEQDMRDFLRSITFKE